MKKFRPCLLMLGLVCAGFAPAQRLFSKDGEAAFHQAVADLQTDPDNLDLRKEIIELSRHLDTPPKKSKELEILEAKAAYLVKNAAGINGYHAAVKAYKKAALMGPWDGDLYYNQGVMEQQSGMQEDAVRDFKLYLLAKPDAADREQVLARIGTLDARKDKQRQDLADSKIQEKLAIHHTVGGTIMGVGICAFVAGGTLLLVNSFDTPGGSYYTQAQGPNEYQGVDYNTLYQGNYYSAASYNSFIAGQRQGMGLGWMFLGAGAVITAVGIVVFATGPSVPAQEVDPDKRSLLNYKSGQLALGVPPMDLMSRGQGLKTTLFHAEF